MKNVFILLLLAFCIHINAQIIHFPDANFKNALVNTKCVGIDGHSGGDQDADLNNDGEIDVNEALSIEVLYLDSMSISNLEGIENFKNLTSLNFKSNHITSVNLSGLNKLNYLNCERNLLTSLNVSGLNKLKYFNCDRNLITSLNVSGLNNLTSFQCQFNRLSTLEVSGLNNLTSFGCSFNKITTLHVSELNSLKVLVCSSNQLTSLDVSGLNNLTQLFCFSNRLTTLNVSGLSDLIYFDCSYNQLTSLDVSNLKKLREMYCVSNQLKSLNIKNGEKISPLSFINNPNLSFICCNENEIDEIKNIAISNGLSNCEVNSYCTFTPGGKYFIIQGKNTYDATINGCDDQDNTISNLKYNITNGSTIGKFIANTTGNYSISVLAGTSTITPIIEYPNHFEVSPSSFTVTFPSASDTISQNFCIKPKTIIFKQSTITIIPLSPPARPGFEAKYKIVWENAGNQIETGTLNFTYDERLLDYISATQSPDQIADGIIKWNFTNLLPFEKREISVTLKVNRPTDTPAVNAGDKLYLTASILDNIFTLENTVVGSYDPNDKTCLQGDRVKPDMVGEYVDYLIRFENTGNYAAENVVVKDIIDTKKFDVSTLQITDASHEVYTRIEGNKVEFIFENIQLPFDDANNDGYIAFKIKTLPTLMLGDSLKNMADIYFDYNFPIRTNEAKTTIALSVPTVDITTDISIYPNPVRDILYLQTDEIWTKAEIYDISGRIMRSVTLHGTSVDVSSLERGTYIIKLRNGDKYGNVKFVKM